MSASVITERPEEGGLFGREFRCDRLADVERVDKSSLPVLGIESGQERAGQQARDHRERIAGEAGGWRRRASTMPGLRSRVALSARRATSTPDASDSRRKWAR